MYKFVPILKSVLWGGEKLIAYKEIVSDRTQIGESWELSGVAGSESVVAEGPDAGLSLSGLLARDGADLLGKSNYARFGNEFPLLVKFIDAKQDLSIQVHPNDALAWQRHRAKGKNEMWYVIGADPSAHLRCGFSERMTPETYEDCVARHALIDRLSDYAIRPGDVFFLPAGCVHTICAGSFIAEIQQTSDITYRIYDYDRRDARGDLRELHTDLAKDAIDYTSRSDHRISYERRTDASVELVRGPYFTTAFAEITQSYRFDLVALDSFLIVVCTAGRGELIDDAGNRCPLHQGETILVPAKIRSLRVEPVEPMTLLTSCIDG